jgi:hypothetical protein
MDIKRAITLTENKAKDSVIEKLFEAKRQAIAIIMDEYDARLVVSDPDSKTNPQAPKYRDEFEQRLIDFDFIKETRGKISFRLPDMETFDFSGNTMKVIEQILEGTAGIYVEVSEEDYEKMFGKRIISRNPLDTSVPKKERIYLMRYDNVLRTAERRTFGQNNYLVKYPFSNTPPIPVLDAADLYVKNNMNKWMDEAVDNAVKKARKGM